MLELETASSKHIAVINHKVAAFSTTRESMQKRDMDLVRKDEDTLDSCINLYRILIMYTFRRMAFLVTKALNFVVMSSHKSVIIQLVIIKDTLLCLRES